MIRENNRATEIGLDYLVSFSDRNYTQKIEAVRYVDKLIRDNFRQVKRTDLTERNLEGLTSVYIGQKLRVNTKRLQLHMSIEAL